MKKLLQTFGIVAGLLSPTFALAASTTSVQSSCCPGPCCPNCDECPSK